MSTTQTIADTLKWLNISAYVFECPFEQSNTIAKTSEGVYVIAQGQTTIYVGKGQIRTRQQKHRDKALNLGGARDTVGWRWLRENTEIDTHSWHILYVLLPRQTQRVAVEGALIHLLQPLANDETYRDRTNP